MYKKVGIVLVLVMDILFLYVWTLYILIFEFLKFDYLSKQYQAKNSIFLKLKTKDDNGLIKIYKKEGT